MNFDEWIDSIDRLPDSKLDNLLKLVKAQRKMINKLMVRLAPSGTVLVLGPDARRLLDEIDKLEAALMNIVN